MAANTPGIGHSRTGGGGVGALITGLTADGPRATVLRLGPIAGWAIALLAALLLPLWLHGSLASRLERLNAEVARVASSELAPLIRQREIPPDLVSAAGGLLEREPLGLNYLTLRNADRVILLSNGRFEGMADWLPATQARQVRGWLYRLDSDDRRLRLEWNGEVVGYLDYGLNLGHAIAGLSFAYWIVLLLWLVALAAVVMLFGPARARWSSLREGAAGLETAGQAVEVPSAPAAATGPDADPLDDEWVRGADALGLGLVIADKLGRIRGINEVAAGLFGRSAAQWRHRWIADLPAFVDAEGRDRQSPLHRCVEGEPGPLQDTLMLGGRPVGMVAARGRGGVRMLLWPDPPARPAGAGSTAAPASAPAAADAFAGSALWSLGEQAALLVDGEGVIRDANPAACRLLEVEASRLNGSPLSTIADGVMDALGENGTSEGETVHAADGRRLCYRVAAIATGGAPAYLLTLASAAVAADDGGRDALTGLPTRERLMSRMTEVWPDSELAAPYALLVLDVIDFGRRNRTLGRDACDTLLAAFAQRLSATVPEAEIVARLGGDEFAVLVRLSVDGEGAETLARRVTEAFAEPVRRGDLELLMAVDLGLAVAPEDAGTAEELLRHAEIALAAVEVAGDHSPRRFVPDMADLEVTGDRLAQSLRRALARRSVELRLRPVWRGAENDAPIAAAWTEIAWNAGGDERYVDAELFELAETLGLTGELAAWYVRTAAETYADWRNIGLSPVPVIVPLPAAATRSPLLAQAWRAAENRFRLPPEALVLVDREGTGEAATVGPRVARADGDEADILYIEAGRDADAEAVKRGVPVIRGPLEAPGEGLWFAAGAEVAVPPRAFGRLIARRGAKPV